MATSSDEISLLKGMLDHFNQAQYDLSSGWNSETFDMPVYRDWETVNKYREGKVKRIPGGE